MQAQQSALNLMMQNEEVNQEKSLKDESCQVVLPTCLETSNFEHENETPSKNFASKCMALIT